MVQRQVSVDWSDFWLVDVPGQQFGDAVHRMIGDMREHMPQVRGWIDAVQLGRTQESIESRCAPSTRIRASEQVVLPAKRNYAERSFSRIVIDLNRAILAVQREA